MSTVTKIILISLCIFFAHCKTTYQQHKNLIKKLNRKSLIQKIHKNYSLYQNLTTSLEFIGYLNGTKHYYIGKLESEAKQKIKLILQEPILHSPLFNFIWDKRQISIRNELKNKKSYIKFTKKSRLNLLNQLVPQKILFMLLQGLPSFIITKNKAIFDRESQSFRVKYLGNQFIISFGEQGELKQVAIKEVGDDKITIIEIITHFWYDKQTSKLQKIKNLSTGSFYKKIHIYNNYSKDYFIIKQTKLTVKFK